MNVFDIMGPIMIGPSSSHTAGAVRIGLITRKLLGTEPIKVQITLHGSFAATGVGHGTDKALIAGLLGMEPDDYRIPKSFEIAEEQGLFFTFEKKNLKDLHPNTAILEVTDGCNQKILVQASSIGGGRISINKIDNLEVNFSGEKPTLIMRSIDHLGSLAEITGILSDNKINIANIQLIREKRGGSGVIVIEMDHPITIDSVTHLKQVNGMVKVSYISEEKEKVHVLQLS